MKCHFKLFKNLIKYLIDKLSKRHSLDSIKLIENSMNHYLP